jgi:CBS domain-containing protein
MPHTPSPPDTESVEISELVDYLAETSPFDTLKREDLVQAARHLEITYVQQGTEVFGIDETADFLYLIRSGAVELHDRSDTLVARLGERDFFGYPALLTETNASRSATAIEDSLFYRLPEPEFDRLRAQSDAFDRFFARAHADRVRDALRDERQDEPLRTPLRTLLSRAPVCVAPSVSIQDAARQMRNARVSSLLVKDDNGLCGLVTDRDVRNRVVAEGRSLDDPLSEVMTCDPVTISAERYAFEALLTMSRHNIHHLPVVDGTRVDGTRLVGMVTTTDIIRLQADSPVYLVGEVWKQDDLDGLVSVSERLPEVVQGLVENHARADDISRVVTTVSDALTQRLLQMAEEQLGPPPVPYAWIALGSQARYEQSAHSDQDNALLLDPAFDREAHDDYFLDLASFVCDGLHACGFVYCPGEVMATTDRWRQPLSQWKATFDDWIQEPTPKALMHSTIFFDLRHIAGTRSLVATLRDHILSQTPQNSIFLASLAVNALDARPPLGFFRQFVLKTHGDQEDTLDLKINGVVPIVDIARIYALAHGVRAVNTQERLSQLADAGGMATDDANDLQDAHAFISTIRLQHQARQIAAGSEPDNYVSPDELSDFNRRHLKDAFKIVGRMQSALEQRYQTGFIS